MTRPLFDFVIENVRTFSGRHVIPVRPLTILTGENSSGKSTLLGMLAAVCDIERFPLRAAFNEPPYNFGNYDTTATYKGGKYGRAKSFTIGYAHPSAARATATAAEATYSSNAGQAELAKLIASSGDTTFALDLKRSTTREITGSYTLRRPEGEVSGNLILPEMLGDPRTLKIIDIIIRSFYEDQKKGPDSQFDIRQFEFLFQLAPMQALSVAPIRTRPARIYGQVSEAYEPTGDHVPFLLERIFREEPASRDRRLLVDALTEFGAESGLFKKFDVKRLGHKTGDPFQLMVTVAGRAANLIDVGYGVSQALPVIVQSVLTGGQRLLLLQQPEVHLHPRAQAALGTFFARLVRGGRAGFVIETHSDYLIDRIRLEVAEGRLASESVQIVFLRRQEFDTSVSVVGLDRSGNIVEAPPGYRQFFLQEELRLLSRNGKD